jgi:hypothetical protein
MPSSRARFTFGRSRADVRCLLLGPSLIGVLLSGCGGAATIASPKPAQDAHPSRSPAATHADTSVSIAPTSTPRNLSIGAFPTLAQLPSGTQNCFANPQAAAEGSQLQNNPGLSEQQSIACADNELSPCSAVNTVLANDLSGAAFATNAWALGGRAYGKAIETSISSFTDQPATVVSSIQTAFGQCIGGTPSFHVLTPTIRYAGISEVEGESNPAPSSTNGLPEHDFFAFVPGANGVIVEVDITQSLGSGVPRLDQATLESVASAAIEAAGGGS